MFKIKAWLSILSIDESVENSLDIWQRKINEDFNQPNSIVDDIKCILKHIKMNITYLKFR